jgi:hypothetical protein
MGLLWSGTAWNKKSPVGTLADGKIPEAFCYSSELSKGGCRRRGGYSGFTWGNARRTPAPSGPSRQGALISPVSDLTSRADVDLLTEGSSGSDYMVDVITSLDFEYNFGNPGSSFRAQHSANSKCERTSSGGTNHGEIQEAVC